MNVRPADDNVRLCWVRGHGLSIEWTHNDREQCSQSIINGLLRAACSVNPPQLDSEVVKKLWAERPLVLVRLSDRHPHLGPPSSSKHALQFTCTRCNGLTCEKPPSPSATGCSKLCAGTHDRDGGADTVPSGVAYLSLPTNLQRGRSPLMWQLACEAILIYASRVIEFGDAQLLNHRLPRVSSDPLPHTTATCGQQCTIRFAQALSRWSKQMLRLRDVQQTPSDCATDDQTAADGASVETSGAPGPTANCTSTGQLRTSQNFPPPKCCNGSQSLSCAAGLESQATGTSGKPRRAGSADSYGAARQSTAHVGASQVPENSRIGQHGGRSDQAMAQPYMHSLFDWAQLIGSPLGTPLGSRSLLVPGFGAVVAQDQLQQVAAEITSGQVAPAHHQPMPPWSPWWNNSGMQPTSMHGYDGHQDLPLPCAMDHNQSATSPASIDMFNPLMQAQGRLQTPHTAVGAMDFAVLQQYLRRQHPDISNLPVNVDANLYGGGASQRHGNVWQAVPMSTQTTRQHGAAGMFTPYHYQALNDQYAAQVYTLCPAMG